MDDFEWNVVNESHLLESMVGHKPVGVNKYFQMAFIWDKLTENIKKDIQSTKIWSHLQTMYNLQVLDESEQLPFPNDEKEFNLPEAEFGALKLKKEEKADDKKNNQKGRETPKMMKEIKKEEVKTPKANNKEIQRRDSKDGKDIKTLIAKKEIKKETEKPKPIKGRTSQLKEEPRIVRNKSDESPRPSKRPTRGSLKPEDANNSGKASPLTVTSGGTKRRRI
ncbi:PREDICTED: MRG/MORF4L-binding protein [Nicrophorus vespilloides]|uniref:MRG/MORF4L-binding protein n=1 Tax=Nicrophorus vespilloides TaxID=110193 RepID=A0ABM1MU47_NICVS|nr:PREDICTED: MRG/MORF4L-binding protein [Nicrophorus vespilloides]